MNSLKLPIALSVVILYLNQVQGAVLIDQQVGLSSSSTIGFYLRENGTVGQSFTPALSNIQFITTNSLGNSLSFGPIEATLRLGLYLGEDRSLGPLVTSADIILRSRLVVIPSEPFNIGYNIVDPLTWVFDMPVSVDPGIKYSFHVDHISGDDLDWLVSLEPYSGGHAIGNVPRFDPVDGFIYGPIDCSYNLSFSTGILIPEPSAVVMILLSSVVFFTRKRASNKSRHSNPYQPPCLHDLP